MDIFKKRETVIENKKKITSLSNEAPFYCIVYFLNSSDDIIYIGRKKGSLREVEQYVLENAQQRLAEYYYLEILLPEENPDDVHAERVLEFQPYGNQNAPRNNKFISATKAKEDYRIDLRQFKKFFKEVGGYLFNNKMYVLKNELLQTFGLMTPYSKNMPRVGYVVISNNNTHWESIKGTIGIYGVLHGGWHSVEQIEEEDGATVTTIKERWPNIEERISRLEEVLSDAYVVDSVLNSEVFTAIHNETGVKKTFSIEKHGIEWTNGPLPYEQDDMYSRLQENNNKIELTNGC